MHVGINLLWLVPGVVGGSEDYTLGLLHKLADRGSPVPVTLFVNRSFAAVHTDLCARLHTVVAPVSGRSKAVRVLADNTWLAWALRRQRITVVHHMGGLVPFVDAGLGRDGARVLTVHDLQPLELPHNFSLVKRWFERVAVPWSVGRADVVSTLSDHVARSVRARFAIPDNQCAVVPPGARRPGESTPALDPMHEPTHEPALESAPEPELPDATGVLDRLGLTGVQFLLYPAITYPHKNHITAIRALAGLRQSHPEVRLVLTGGTGGAEETVAAVIAASGCANRIVRPGRVTSTELVALYRGATALVFPSRFEGFGLPVLEAMRLGCPVVVSSTTAVADLAGDAGLAVDPDDVAGWSTAMARVCDDDSLRRTMAATGVERAAGYTWDRSVDALQSAWQLAQAIAGGQRSTTTTGATP